MKIIKVLIVIFINVRLLKTISKIIEEAEESYNLACEKGAPLEELDKLEENYKKSLKLMDMLETKNKSHKSIK